MESLCFVIRVFAIGVLSIGLAGCSTIFGRQHDEETVFFESNVPEVEVVCSGRRTLTPGSFPLRQSKNHACTAQKEGYEKKVFEIRSGVSGSGLGHSFATNTATWGWWTLGIGTAVGMLVDLPAGSMKNLTENSIYLDMRPVGGAGPNMAKKIVIKTASVGKNLVMVPVDAVRETTETVIDTTIGKTAREMGVAESNPAPTPAPESTPAPAPAPEEKPAGAARSQKVI